MPLFLCCAHLAVPTSTSHLVSDTASVEQAALSSLYLCFFHVLLCMVCVLKPVWIRHVDNGRVVFHHFSHSSVKSIVICKSHCNSWCHRCFTKFLWLVLGKNTSGSFSLLSGILCLVTFCFSTVGAIAWLFIWMSSNIQLRKDLDATCCFSAFCLFLCHVLFEGSKCFLHKTLAYLFLRICWMISSQHSPQFDRERI